MIRRFTSQFIWSALWLTALQCALAEQDTPFNANTGLFSVAPHPFPDAINATGPPLLILLVFSPVDAVHERDAIRATWGRTAAECNVKIIFPFLSNYKMKSRNRTVQREADTFGDVFRSPKGKDNYYNDYEFVRAALLWATEAYPHTPYIGRATDDVWINFPKILHQLRQLRPDGEFIMGHFVAEGSAAGKEVVEGFFDLPESDAAFALPHLWIVPAQSVVKLIKAVKYSKRPLSTCDMLITGYARHFRTMQMFDVLDYVNLWDLDPNYPESCTEDNFSVIHGVYSKQKKQFYNSCIYKENCRETL